MDLDRGPICRVHSRAPLNDSRPNARDDVDIEDFQTNPTRRTLGASKMMCEKAIDCRM